MIAGEPEQMWGEVQWVSNKSLSLKDPKMLVPPSSESDKVVLLDSAPHREKHDPREGGRVGENVLD